MFEGDHQEERTLLVPEKQVLGVHARNRAAQGLCLLDREQWRMAHGAMQDAELVQIGEEVSRCCWSSGHGGRNVPCPCRLRCEFCPVITGTGARSGPPKTGMEGCAYH